MSKAGELRELSTDELDARLADAKAELFRMRFDNATGQLDNTAGIRGMKKEIARLKTLLRLREIQGEQ